MFLMCVCVCLSGCKISQKSCERILMKFSGGVERGLRNSRSDFGCDPNALPQFLPMMHFQCNSNTLLLHSAGNSTSLDGGNALYRVLSNCELIAGVALYLLKLDCSYACTAFAFGQTGSGKTHTITGPPEQVPYGVCLRHYVHQNVFVPPVAYLSPASGGFAPDPTWALPLDPAGRLPSQNPLCSPVTNSWLRPCVPQILCTINDCCLNVMDVGSCTNRFLISLFSLFFCFAQVP